MAPAWYTSCPLEMNYYWLYYLAPLFLAYAQNNPLFALTAIGFFAVRPWLPDPVVIMRNLSRIGGLRRQAQLNPANVIARRDLALLRTGDADGALRAFGGAVGIDPDKGEPKSSEPAGTNERTFRRYGEAYLGAADALERLGRLPQAEDALELAASNNTSTLEPLVRLARVRRRQGNTAKAKAALVEARRTFTQLPGYAKRKQLGWWMRALVGV